MTDGDAQVAAIMADTLQMRLQDYITRYRTKKARDDARYYAKLREESRQDYLKAQHQYAVFADANQDATLATVKSEEEALENEMQLKFNVYNQMSAQLQQAQAKVQEQTPAFTIIEKATVPNKPSSTPRSMILMLFVVLSMVADIVWVLMIAPYRKRQRSKKKASQEQLRRHPAAAE